MYIPVYNLSRPWNKTFTLPFVFFSHVVQSYSNECYGHKYSYKRQQRKTDDNHFHSSEACRQTDHACSKFLEVQIGSSP